MSEEMNRLGLAQLILPNVSSNSRDSLRVRLNRNIVRMDIEGVEVMLTRPEVAELATWLKVALEKMP